MVRFKNRYLLVEVHSDPGRGERRGALRGVTTRSLLLCIRDAITSLHGEYGLACVLHSLTVKYLNVVTGVAIVRCPRAYHRAVWSAMATITTLQGTSCSVTLIHLGGTIRSCQRHLVSHNQTQLRQMLASATTPLEHRELHTRIEQILHTDSIPIPA